MASDNHMGIDLAEVPHAEIRAHLADYLGSPNDAELDAATAAALTFVKMPDSESRQAALSGLRAFFCSHCGKASALRKNELSRNRAADWPSGRDGPQPN